MTLLIHSLAKLNSFLGRLCLVLSGILMALMTSAVILQVISREMRRPIGWTEELALAAMVWLAFLIGPWAYRNFQMTRIDVFFDMLSARKQRVLSLVIHCFEAVVLIFVSYLSWAFFLRGTAMLPALTSLIQDFSAIFVSPEAAKGLWVPNAAIYAVLPLGFGMMLLVNLELVLRSVATFLYGKDFGLEPERLSSGHGGVEGSVVEIDTETEGQGR